MRRSGFSNLPLHPGRAPAWLFKRMVPLARHITEAIVDEYSPGEFLSRVSDPFWFQAFGCVLGFDWHSSGLTTTTTGALKEGLAGADLGIAVCGGKGSASRKAPAEIATRSEELSMSTKNAESLVHASRMSAKVDSACLQDGYGLYHHCFIFTGKGDWAVVQQGLNPANRYARRYHWASREVRDLVEEPHSAICCDASQGCLDLTSRKSRESRKTGLDLVRDSPSRLLRHLTGQSTLMDFSSRARTLHMPRSHYILNMDRRNLETLMRAHEIQPGSYEELLGIRGVGPKTVRALALISDIVYGTPASWEDPVRFSFAHGGKDGIPYPVDRESYDRSIEVLRAGIEQSRLGNREMLGAVRRLKGFMGVAITTTQKPI